MPETCSIVWFRQDLRLTDNPALDAAAAAGRPVLCVYVLDDETAGDWKMGGASRWWLHHSLKALAQALEEKGQKLILRRGRADREITRLLDEAGAAAVYWNRCYEPFAVKRDAALKATLASNSIDVRIFNSALLHEPWTVCTKEGHPYKVFSAFWRAARRNGEPDRPSTSPKDLPSPPSGPRSDSLDEWTLLPREPDWAGGFRECWRPGEAGAAQRIAQFLDHRATDYKTRRDMPGTDGTSGLSPHLHFGEISPRTIWWASRSAADSRSGLDSSIEKFLAELGWREFSYHLLYHFPSLPKVSLRREFRNFPWKRNRRLFNAWTHGLTGYPLVDAGMRQLRESGWMHNRVRMNAASLLVKHLLQPWQDGEKWFWDTLVDADLANNAASWQWVAGCGADAAPYFRIFNPVIQGERFDPRGDYIRRHVPELANLPDSHIHKPWEAPEDMLEEAGVRLGKDYPYPVIDHRHGRQRALAAFESIKANSG